VPDCELVPANSELERMLRGASLRVTRPRVAVLAAVHDDPHADTHTIIDRARDELGAVSQQAV
jgi:Fur family ferric uptake transcriptional regulator